MLTNETQNKVLGKESVIGQFRPGIIKLPGMFPGGKGGRCVELTTLPPSSADCLEIWEPLPPGTLRACPGL